MATEARRDVMDAPEAGAVPRNVVLQGDALTLLRTLPDACVQVVVTSPPYYGLRDYGTAQWEGGDPACDHLGAPVRTSAGFNARYFGKEFASDKQGQKRAPFRAVCPKCSARRVDAQLGLEATPGEFIEVMVSLFREVWRVLRADGVVWLNLGDSYGNDDKWGGKTGGKHALPLHGELIGRARRQTGAPPKSLLLMPHRVALALMDDGWTVRQDCVWAKGNPMPESVNDRPTRSHEYVFLLAKSERYFYDAEAVLERVTGGTHSRGPVPHPMAKTVAPGQGIKNNASFNAATWGQVSARNKRSVWMINPASFPAAHFATFPEALVEPCVLSGSSPFACETCGAPWRRQTKTNRAPDRKTGKTALRGAGHMRVSAGGPANRVGRVFEVITGIETTGWEPTCRCERNTGAGRCIVLDPFMGSGTVGVVAQRLNRDWLGLELNPTYAKMARTRILSAGCAHTSLKTVGDDDIPDQLPLFRATSGWESE